MHRAANEAAAAALADGGHGPRAMTLDEEDDEEGPATRFIGQGSVSRHTGGPVYDRLRGGNTLESPGVDVGLGSPIDPRSQVDLGGGVPMLAPVPIVLGTGEEASLMHPSNRSAPLCPMNQSRIVHLCHSQEFG